LLLLTIAAIGQSVAPADIRVLDGDTIEAHGKTYRLVGFDAPETDRAKCEAERVLGAKAKARMEELVAGAETTLSLDPVVCSCRTGTQGTKQCNYGRLCGTLRAQGEDVGIVLMRERLARSYVCSATRCPRRQRWC
jgi:endonuclease YncB( thermonuclease family)